MNDEAVPVELDLSDIEIRMLGVLLEKESTTPDVYPMTTKAVVSACNQKSSRNPVMAVQEREIDQAAMELRQRKLTRSVRESGARASKHRHCVDETWQLSQPQLAILAVLLLRGEQTPGELRSRTERIHAFNSVPGVEVTLTELANRTPPLAHKLPRHMGEKQDRWDHVIGKPSPDPDTLPPPLHTWSETTDGDSGAIGDPDAPTAAEIAPNPTTAAPPSPNAIRSASAPDPEQLRREPAEVRGLYDDEPADSPSTSELADLRAEVASLRRTIDEICTQLGISPPA